MSSRLDKIENWPELAREAGYHVKTLASQCEVSPRTLERFFLSSTGKSPQRWLNELRQSLAARSMNGSKSVKEVAHELGYKQTSHFSRVFKRFHGVSPASWKPRFSARESRVGAEHNGSRRRIFSSVFELPRSASNLELPGEPRQLQLPLNL